MNGILLAVAIHDGRPQLDSVAPSRLAVQAGERVHLRIAYTFVDRSSAREDAILEAEVHLDKQGPWRASAAMHDRPLINDSKGGQLTFELPALLPGAHKLTFKIRLQTSRQRKGLPRLHTAELEKAIHLDAS